MKGNEERKKEEREWEEKLNRWKDEGIMRMRGEKGDD